MMMDIAKPATILIDQNYEVKMSFGGIRNKSSREYMINQICKNC
jgi:hypothetical protein